MQVLDRIDLIPLSMADSAERVGAKALRLAELLRAGIPVPEALVLPADAEALPDAAVLEALGGCLAVRSSATVEDAPGASFAGQFQSFLNVHTLEGLGEAVRAVRASAHSEAVRAYCASRGIDPAAVRTAVILQRMVKADVAGVLFTVDPVSGRESDMLVEACPGLADDLLGGRISGTRIPVRDGRPSCDTSPPSQAQVRRLVALGQQVQRLMGCPQDVEWAFAGDDLFVLQARPITRLCFAGIAGEWTNADFRDGGVSGGVVAPLVGSLYEYVWERALKRFLRDLHVFEADFPAFRVFYGRPYWNLGAVKRCASKLPGFIEREFDRDLGVAPRYAGDGACTPAGFWSVLRAGRTVFAARRVFRTQEASDRKLLHTGLPRRFAVDPRDLDDRELLRCFGELVHGPYREVEENYFRTIFCMSLAKLDFKAALGDLPLSYPTLVGGLDNLSHLECARALWQLANASEGGWNPKALAFFLERHGHHSRRELDLRVPRWSEDIPFVTELARRLVGTEDPAIANQRQRRLCAEELRRARRLLPFWRWWGFRRKLVRLWNYLWLREQMRDLSTRAYALIRRLALELGRRATAAGHIAAEGDVFYLRLDEILRGLDGGSASLVAGRREYEEMYLNFRPPNEVGRGFALAPVEHPGKRLTGIGCSTGLVTGRVRVVTALEEARKLERGDLLVAPFTDPGWTPLLNLAAGVVTETGGLLSHAAVICREYGLPAVLNVAGATRLLRDGQRVRIDGENGYVDIL
jgi:pyruvate,water dikinase